MGNLNPFAVNTAIKTVDRYNHVFGELPSFYFYWIFHFLRWLIFFCLIFLILYSLEQFSISKRLKIYGIPAKKLFDYIFSFLFVLWRI
jgi:hypothetical protein